MRLQTLLLAITLGSLMMGCAAPGKYHWGKYDRAMYSYYKDAAKDAEYIAELESIIKYAEQAQRPVAPGIHAEYGYMLLQRGKINEAIAQFDAEKTKWPESTQLMNVMIEAAPRYASKQAKAEE